MIKFVCGLITFAIFAVPLSTQARQSIGDRLAADIRAHAGSQSRGQCAAAVRQSIERVTGTSLRRTQHAKDYGSSLQNTGFRPIPNGSPLRPGDVRIIQSTRGHPSGHMQMYTAQGWTSDFRQRDQWPGSAYRQQQPSFITYRLEG